MARHYISSMRATFYSLCGRKKNRKETLAAVNLSHEKRKRKSISSCDRGGHVILSLLGRDKKKNILCALTFLSFMARQ